MNAHVLLESNYLNVDEPSANEWSTLASERLPCVRNLLAWLLRLLLPSHRVTPFPFAFHTSFLPSFLPFHLPLPTLPIRPPCLVVSLLDADCARHNIDAVNRSRDIVTNRIATRAGIVSPLDEYALEAAGTHYRVRWFR